MAHIEKFFKSRKIERDIKKRGDKILENRSFVGTSTYCTESAKRKDGLGCIEIHFGAYKFYAMYITQSLLDDLSSIDELGSCKNILQNALNKEREKWKNEL